MLDCLASAVTFIAHDGSVGVLYNHIPFLSELGPGIMEVTVEGGADGDGGENAKRLAYIDGGFALVGLNLVNIIASEAVCGWDTSKEKIGNLLEKSQKNLAEGVYGPQQRMHEIRRNALLEKLSATLK